MRFGDEIVNTYPYPIAWACYEFNNALENIERFMKLATLFERLLRFLTFTSVAAYIQNEHFFEKYTEEIKTEFKKLQRPTLGDLCSIMGRTLNLYNKEKVIFPIPEMTEAFSHRLLESSPVREACRFITNYLGIQSSGFKNLLQFLELMISYRNNTWGHGIGQIDRDFAEKHCAILYPALEEVLKELSFLAHYRLNYIIRVEVQGGKFKHYITNFNGLNPSKYPLFEVEIGSGNYYEGGRVYLFSPEGKPVLLLHPFYIVHSGELYYFSAQDRDEKLQFRHSRDEGILRPQQVDSFLLPAIVSGDTKIFQKVEIGSPEDKLHLAQRVRKAFEGLSQESQEILEVAAGEAVRMGHQFVNEVHLFMAMTRYEDSLVPSLLEELKMEPRLVRAILRGILGFQGEVKRWDLKNFQEVGRTALQMGEVQLDLRLERVLKEALIQAKMEEEGQVKPFHLLVALMTITDNMIFHFFNSRGYNPENLVSIIKTKRLSELVSEELSSKGLKNEIIERLSRVQEELKWVIKMMKEL